MTSEERRDNTRRNVQVGVTMTSDSNFYVGFTDNISQGGLFVATHEFVEIGELVTLEFELPGSDRTMQVDGKVCWQRKVSDRDDGVYPGFGVQFVDLDEVDREHLQSFLEKREPMFHPD